MMMVDQHSISACVEAPHRGKEKVFFERGGLMVHRYHSRMSGNPVRIGGGCATVTGYKIPMPLVSAKTGKAGVRSSPKPGYRLGCARHGRQERPLLRHREG